jgi:hypothetical protein
MGLKFRIGSRDVNIVIARKITSVVINDMLTAFSSEQTINIPSVYYPAINNYRLFLAIVDDHRLEGFYDKKLLVTCFNFASYLDDSGYFDWLLKQLFSRWSYLSPITYSSLLTD